MSDVDNYIQSNKNIICSRVVVEKESILTEENSEEINSLDYLQEFNDYINKNLEVSDKDLLKSELENILR